MSKLLIKNIGLLQTPTGSYSHKGKEQGNNLKLKNASILAEDGKIMQICSEGELPVDAESADMIIDAEGKLVTPGLVDGHTHLVFGGFRQHEIPLKLAGATYLDILKAGGGILDTVKKTREADFDELYDKSESFLDEMLEFGVTTCEAKSGYGLDMDNELKILKVIKKLDQMHPMDIIATYMGGHAVPPEYIGRADEYIDSVCRQMMAIVSDQKLAEYVDVFCEEGAFDFNQSKRYLETAVKYGLGLKIHADEIEEIGGSELAGLMKAASAEHLIAVGEKGLAALACGGTTAMLLPATSFYLGKTYAPARRMIELGIPVALATDFNPGSCPSLNLQLAMNLGYLKYKMNPEEILTAVTINPACALGRGKMVGTIEVGKNADLVIWDAPDMEMLCYRFGSNLTIGVIKNGCLV